MSNSPCRCGSGKRFADCCEPFLLLQSRPKSARALVRALYCAYARGAGTYRDFLLRTWHPATASRVNPLDLTNDSFTWTGLDIVFAEQKGDRARVEFKASFTDPAGKLHVHHERAVFQRHQGQWYYLDGQVRDLDPTASP